MLSTATALRRAGADRGIFGETSLSQCRTPSLTSLEQVSIVRAPSVYPQAFASRWPQPRARNEAVECTMLYETNQLYLAASQRASARLASLPRLQRTQS